MRGAIFDVDGTLLDSMGCWDDACRIFLRKRNIELSDEQADKLREMRLEHSIPMIIEKYALNITVEEAIDELKAIVAQEYLTSVRLKPYADEYLRKLKSDGVKIAVATSGYKELCQGAFKHLGIIELIDEYAFSSEVNCGKDRPDVYLLAAEKIGVAPSECMVFEDIASGIQSSKAAGFMTCAIYDFSNEVDTDVLKQYADHYITGWKALL